jgi:hypothetical protein
MATLAWHSLPAGAGAVAGRAPPAWRSGVDQPGVGPAFTTGGLGLPQLVWRMGLIERPEGFAEMGNVSC